jgi:hypothetical protein
VRKCDLDHAGAGQWVVRGDGVGRRAAVRATREARRAGLGVQVPVTCRAPPGPDRHPVIKEKDMPIDTVERFLAALDPRHREQVQGLPREERERLAEAWETELRQDTDLDTLSELSPAAAESEAAARVAKKLLEK